MNEEDYTKITYDTTLHFAKAILNQNPEIIFSYVSVQVQTAQKVEN